MPCIYRITLPITKPVVLICQYNQTQNRFGVEVDTRESIQSDKIVLRTAQSQIKEINYIQPFYSDGAGLKPLQGIGVIIVEAMRTKITMYYQGDKENPEFCIHVSDWNLNSNDKRNLHADLGSGMDVVDLLNHEM